MTPQSPDRVEMDAVRKIIGRALEEDIRSGDVTTSFALAGSETGQATALAKEDLVVAGLEVFREVFRVRDASLVFATALRDGARASQLFRKACDLGVKDACRL